MFLDKNKKSKEKGRFRKFTVRVIITQEMYFENGNKVVVINFSEVTGASANVGLKTDDINIDDQSP